MGSLPRHVVIAVCGSPAAGKTTIARSVAERTHLALITRDELAVGIHMSHRDRLSSDEIRDIAEHAMIEVGQSLAEVGRIRRSVRKLLLPGQSRLHFKSESPRRRRQLMGQLIEMELDVAVVFRSSSPGLNRGDLRDRCLAEVIADAQERGGPAQMYLESRHHQDEADDVSFARWRRPAPPLNYEHVAGAADPMLWVPDAFAWLAGAGGEWTAGTRSALRRHWEAP